MDEFNTDRTIEEINEVLHMAKLTENDVLPKSQVLFFSPETRTDYTLLQLDASLLNEVQEGSLLKIKGKEEDDVVICSETKTYHVSEAETSNCLLLLENLQFSESCKSSQAERSVDKAVVCGMFYTYLEAGLAKPCFDKLQELLSKSSYKGPEHEYLVNQDVLYSFEELDEVLQGSTKQIQEVLNTMDLVVIDNKYRLLDFEYHFRVLSYMLKLIEENSWSLDAIDYEETINVLSDLVPEEVLESLFHKYCRKTRIVDGVQLYEYNQLKVCQFFAKVLLHNTGKFNLNEFLQAWKEAVPEGMVPEEAMLQGIAIVDRQTKPNKVFEFREEDLSLNVNERLKELFAVKTKWTLEEITPYIQRLTTEKLDVNALLTKWARSSKCDGVKYYSAKHFN